MPTRRDALRALGAGVATALAGCLAGAPRATFEFDPLAPTDLDEHASAQLQGGLRNRGYVDRQIPSGVALNWSLPLNAGDHTAAKSTPVSTPDGDVIAAADTGTVRRVRPDGEVRWTASVEPTERGIHGTPAIANGTVYVGAYDGAMYAFDLADGERRWRRPLGDAIGSSPVYYNGAVYVAVEFADPSGSVAAVHAGSGYRLWRDGRPTDQPHSTLAIDRDAGRLVVGANDGNCYAWTFPGLERAWVVETPRPIKGPIAVHDGVAVVGSWDGHVYGVDLADGAERWAVDTGADVMSGPAVDPEGTVYAGNHHGALYAIDAVTGDRRWDVDLGGAIVGALTATPEHVLVGTYDRQLHAVEAATGDSAWTARAAGRVTSAPLVTDDAIYVAERRPREGERGSLYRFIPA